MAGIKDVAKRAGVGVATVSRQWICFSRRKGKNRSGNERTGLYA